ncbi:MAG TPA: PAS domain-containing protein [Longimicrobium sp.]|jgi:PAS domain S-box-containing protein|uniref:PAS domain-containing sensor histidine kinase n=1 Tax=Longimicrobium sp. TaxID=2029185 RepID=UPI002EDA06E9
MESISAPASVQTPDGLNATLAALLLQTSAAGVGWLDRDLRYVRVNSALAEMNGLAAESHPGRHIREVLPPGAVALVEPILTRALETGEPVTDMPVLAPLPGGGTRHFEASYWPVREHDGAISGLVAFVANRTPAENALRESESRLRRVAESGIVGLFDWGLDGRILAANDAFLKLLGYTRDDLEAGRVDWRGMTPPEYEATDAAAVAQMLATGSHGPIAKEYYAADGNRVPVVVTSAFLEGSTEQGVCVCLDDTARREAESRLARVLMQTPAAVGVLLGPNHVVHSVNEMFYRVLGRRDYMGRPAAEGAPELVEQGFLALMDQVYRTGVPYEGREAPLVWDRAGDGTLVEGFFDFVYQPLFDPAGAVEGILVFAVEVTAQVRARREVEQLLTESEQARAREQEARAEAEAANRAKSDFLAVMSHELRTPLNAIGGYVELIEMGIRGPVTAEQLVDLARIQQSQRHLLGLINEVLNYARLETGTVQYDTREVRVLEALLDAESLVAPQARARGMALVVAECPLELSVLADPEKLRQILVNVVGNAVKFTDADGRVEISCAASGEQVHVRIRDNGIGIPEDKLEAIFDPFVQVRSDLARPHQGTGLGLAISRDLARGMGGNLVAQSTPGEGSLFTLTLPAA